MDRITLRNFRCFGEEQTARLAPLTLLVGENSTGKTSFMSMVRALWNVAYRHEVPDFKERPYDLGSFDEIVHNPGTKKKRLDTFEAGFNSTNRPGKKSRRSSKTNTAYPHRFEVIFGKDGTVPIPVRRHLSHEKLWIEESFEPKNRDRQLRVGTERGSWEFQSDSHIDDLLDRTHYRVNPLFYSLMDAKDGFAPSNSSKEISEEDLEQLFALCSKSFGISIKRRPYASAPVRSRPRRTYDPDRFSPDPEGDYIPMYLADLSLRNEKDWEFFKSNLEDFGQDSGLFDEITVKRLGKNLALPFQLQVRKFRGKRKGPWRNLVDVGYGVSQVLPVITELLRQDAAPLILLQQPEVHLHPSAQAFLGSLFCRIAARGSQLIIETHSDFILDRIRIEIRKKDISLKPEDVSILFFERQELDISIHSIQLDEEGNILNAPPNYRNFFMEESQRFWGL